MTDALMLWWRERSLREQRLLLVMFALLVMVLGWLLVIRPLGDALDRAQSDHAQAVTALAEARGHADAARRLEGERGPAATLPIEGLVRQTSAGAGFTNARIAAQGPARATFAIDAARPQPFFTWVRVLERRGIAVETLRARANGDRTLAVEAVFRARGRR